MSEIDRILQNKETLTYTDMQSKWAKIKDGDKKTAEYQFFCAIFSSDNPKATFKTLSRNDEQLSKEDIFSLAKAGGDPFKITNADFKAIGINTLSDDLYLGLDFKTNKLLTGDEVKTKIEDLTKKSLNELKSEKAKFGRGNFNYAKAAKSNLTDYQALDLMDGKLDNKLNVRINKTSSPKVNAFYRFVKNKSSVTLNWNNLDFNNPLCVKSSLIHESVHARDNDNKVGTIEEAQAIRYQNDRLKDDNRAPIIKSGLSEYAYKSLVFEQHPNMALSVVRRGYKAQYGMDMKETSPGHGAKANPNALKL